MSILQQTKKISFSLKDIVERGSSWGNEGIILLKVENWCISGEGKIFYDSLLSSPLSTFRLILKSSPDKNFIFQVQIHKLKAKKKLCQKYFLILIE